MMGYTWKLRGLVFLLNFVAIGIFAGLGALIDYYVASSPKGLVIAVLISFPFTQFITRYALRRYFKKHEQELHQV